MAPEQARGEALDERADVFGLGGILCEIVTGQSPFQLPRSAALWLLDQDRDLRQVHVRLVGCGADPELVRLAQECLAETPDERPANAKVVAERMALYRTSAQERLRRAEVERAAAEARVEAASACTRAERRARQLLACLTLAGLLLVGLVCTAGWWWQHHRNATDNQVRMLLNQADQMIARAQERSGSEEALERFREAGNLLAETYRALENGLGSDGLREELRQRRERIRTDVLRIRRDRLFLERLTEIRIQKEDEFDQTDTDGQYLTAFRKYGLDVETSSPTELAGVLRERSTSFRREVTAALDDWCQERRRLGMPESRWLPLVRLASMLDDGPWRNALRQLLVDESHKVGLHHELLALDVATCLFGQSGITAQLFAGALDTARRRSQLRELAVRADSDQLSPASAQLLAAMLRQEGDHAGAIRLLRAAQQRHSGDVWLNHDLARALYQQPIPQTGEAIRFYTAARAIRPEIGHALAHALKAKGLTEEAAGILRELIRLRPNNANHYNCLGVIHASMKNPTRALALYHQALGLNPTLGPAWLNLGVLLAAQQDNVEAEKALRQATRHLPRTAEPFERLANLLHRCNRRAEAEQAYRAALELEPANSQTLVSLAILINQPNASPAAMQEAARLYEKAIVVRPNNPVAYTNLGLIRWGQGRHAEGLELIRRACEQKPDYMAAQWQLGIMLSVLGRPAQALEPLNKALILSPKHAGVLADLAHVLGKVSRNDEGVRRFREALALDPRNSAAAYNFGILLYKMGQFAEAIVWLRRTLVLDPKNAEAACNLGHALRDHGEFREALNSMRRGHELGKSQRAWTYPSARWVRHREELVAVDAILPDLLAGRQPFSSLGQRLLAIRICWHKRMHAARVKLIRDALADDPRLAESSPGIDRTSAAVSALAVVEGKSVDAPNLSPRDHSAMREQALAWLEAELERSQAAPERTDMAARADARRRLMAWSKDPVFACIHEEAAIRELPAEQRQRCRRLWEEVKRLLAGKAGVQ
jgi:tetratricopeptide (TPR) repeat protein